MLKGGWGIGKSHYIQNRLTPFLRERGRMCVVLSFYSLRELSEISKGIYLCRPAV